MAKQIDSDDRQKWRGYLSGARSLENQTPLTEELIKSHVAAWKGQSVTPERTALNPTIAEVRGKGVVLKLPGGKFHNCSFKEIIAADAVIRYWLAKGLAPDTADFRNPDAEIRVGPISNNSYAPALAERVRRAQRDAEPKGTVVESSVVNYVRPARNIGTAACGSGGDQAA